MGGSAQGRASLFYYQDMMKLYCRAIQTLVIAALSLSTISCDDADKDEATLAVSRANFGSDGGTASLKVSCDASWVLEVEASDKSANWVALSALNGTGGQVVSFSISENDTYSPRKATFRLRSGAASDTASVFQSARTRQANTNANDPALSPEAMRMEMPHMSSEGYQVTHYATVAGEKDVNYALEWNIAMRHAQWVAFAFDKNNCAKNVTRSNDFLPDPDLPVEMQTTNYNHTSDGFDRGHLCASNDRAYSEETNAQTFYFSNMSPQLNGFNAGIWQRLEAEVQTWGQKTASRAYDTLYVAKGGTLNHLLINFEGKTKGMDGKTPTTDSNGLTVKGLPCPAYYFMAIMSVKSGMYSSIAFLLPHSDQLKPVGGGADFTVADLKQYAVTVDELEQETGLDFFCNLPDDTESEVESVMGDFFK